LQGLQFIIIYEPVLEINLYARFKPVMISCKYEIKSLHVLVETGTIRHIT